MNKESMGQIQSFSRTVEERLESAEDIGYASDPRAQHTESGVVTHLQKPTGAAPASGQTECK